MNIFVQNTRTVEKNLTSLYIFGNLSKNNFIKFYFKKNQNHLLHHYHTQKYKNGTEKKKKLKNQLWNHLSQAKMFQSPSNSTDMLLNILLNINDCQKIIALVYQLASQTKVL